jgi:hypothetical protein
VEKQFRECENRLVHCWLGKDKKKGKFVSGVLDKLAPTFEVAQYDC